MKPIPETISEATLVIRHGELRPIDLVETCLARIDQSEPAVQAWVFVDQDYARGQARQLTEELDRGWYRGPLHGIPLGIKDIFDVFDWPTAAGSALWANSIARADSTAVRKLRQAGAIFLGKTVTTQYASFDPPKTRNPWNRERTPGGSSSGSAAALACGMCLGALGSQTGGSITRPASYCAVTGCKPTYGRVGAAGVVPLAWSMDHPGPMARCVRDLALLLQVIAGPDPLDPSGACEPVPEYTAAIEKHQEAPRIGLLRGLFADLAEPAMQTLLELSALHLRRAGAQVTPVALPAAFAEVLPRHRIIMAVEAAAFHKERLERYPDDYQPNIRGLLEEGLRCPAPEYARCKEHQQQLARQMQACFTHVDVLLAPATRGAAPSAATTGDPAFNSPWSYTGLPVVSFPAGWTDDGLPLALQLIGPAWREDMLLAAAAWCEQAIALERREPSTV
jgi:aspartyl-tRNA(Asn)/glutamyl-tRNA(Gln) amidotransferase subunit A